MLGRNRRLRYLALVALGAFAFLFYIRNTGTVNENAEFVKEKVVGGGAVIRPVSGEGEEVPLVAEPAPGPEPQPLPAPEADAANGAGAEFVEDAESETSTAAEVDSSTTSEVPATKATDDTAAAAPHPPSPVEQAGEGHGRNDVESQATYSHTIYWSKMPENYPVTSTIQLPSGTPKAIPRIQADKELAKHGEDKERLDVIKGTATFAWKGYKQMAWGADEVRPVSGKAANPFNGWGATLVDALDTLWIMGMVEEFEDAVEKVKEIDFTTSPRWDIPVFEVTIRYLGGLVSAYDISGRKHRALLDKAVEIGEILYGAFDTPNRMPLLYYDWKPSAMKQPKRAGFRVVLAELGSLSMEFTRLAQLTGEPKYYDAVARITNALEKWQMETKLPGMWPMYLDASGCEKPGQNHQDVLPPVNLNKEGPPTFIEADKHSGANGAPAGTESWQKELHEAVAAGKPGTGKVSGFGSTDDKEEVEKILGDLGSTKRKRDDSSGSEAGSGTVPHLQPPVPSPTCTPHGLDSSSKSESFTLGGASDSTYEYLPKQYLLLGGHADEYRTMYLSSAQPVIDYLLFKPMTPDEQDILVSGSLKLSPNYSAPIDEPQTIETFTPELTHLTCFAGGMFALGGAIFNEPSHIEIGARLTEGCFWGYNSTASGIMPETATLLPCKDTWGPCPWDEAAYWDALDPHKESRTRSLEADRTVPLKDGKNGKVDKADTRDTLDSSDHVKRSPPQDTTTDTTTDAATDAAVRAGLAVDPHPYHPPPPLPHEAFVAAKIADERLPPGFVRLNSKQYLLRPEAIESVWYMWRVTGDVHWREVAWEMFKAVDGHTRARYGNSAVDDVTKSAPELVDGAESFWLGETLKYFYLIFSAPDLVSLDEWVLNTEAHPFQRQPFEFKGE